MEILVHPEFLLVSHQISKHVPLHCRPYKPIRRACGAQSGAFSGVDLELVAVIQAWAELRREREGRPPGKPAGVFAQS